MKQNNLMELMSVMSLIIVLIFLFFASFLLTVKTNNKTRNGLLAAFLILTAIDISAFFYYRYIALPPQIEMLRSICFSFLKDPLLFLYVLSLIYTDFKLKPKHLIHLSMFVLSIIVLVPGFFMTTVAVQHNYLKHLNAMPEIKFLLVLMKGQSTFYIIAMIILLRKYKVLLLENYASNISLSNYKWLSQLVVVMIILVSITMGKDFLKVTAYTDIADGLTMLMLIAGLVFVFWIVLNALYYPDLFRGIDSALQPVESMIDQTGNTGTTAKTELSKDELEKIQILKAYMALEEPYLEPSLTIQDLATSMKMPVRDLSILINHRLDQHFFDFVNEYRIQKAMKILKDPARKELTILEILYEVGFNSKSSFNTAFKKHADLTPTQYRNS